MIPHLENNFLKLLIFFSYLDIFLERFYGVSKKLV